MKYRPEIDGLRAVAVVPVILFHAGLAGFSGGYIGVDVFFVISGYLITSIILEEHESHGFSFGRFYERRMRRLLPALFVVMAACLVPAWLWLLPADLEEFAHSLGFVSLFLSNFHFFDSIDYFSGPAEELPLLHTWSLAVEEQFYIFFPIMLLVLWRWRNIRNYVLLAMFALSLGWAQYASGTYPAASFFLLPSRFWELLAGAGCAIWIRQSTPKPNGLLAMTGVAMILASVFLFTSGTLHPSLWTLLPVAGSCLAILFATPTTLVARMLSLPLIVGVGLISYSAYLWHQPLFAFARAQSLTEPPLMVMLALAVLSLCLAWLTWRFVEQPVRRAHPVFATRRKLFTASGLGIAAFLALAIIGEVNDGFGSRYEALRIASFEPNNRVLQQESWEPLRQASGIQDYRDNGQSYEDTLWFDPDDPRPGLVITGDSHAKDLFNTLVRSKSATDAFQIAIYRGRPESIRSPDYDLYEAPNFLNAKVVLLASRHYPDLLSHIGPAIDQVKSHGKLVAVVLNTPEFSGDVTTNLADSIVFPLLRSGLSPNPLALSAEINQAYTTDLTRNGELSMLNAKIASIAKAHEVMALDRHDYICPDLCRAVSSDLQKLIYDYGHLSLAGASVFAKTIDRIGWINPLVDAASPLN